jgi:hypothetical protein
MIIRRGGARMPLQRNSTTTFWLCPISVFLNFGGFKEQKNSSKYLFALKIEEKWRSKIWSWRSAFFYFIKQCILKLFAVK